MNRFLLACLFGLSMPALPIFAAPQPTDQVMIMNWGFSEQDDIKRYTKMWKDIKLAPQTVAKINQKIKALEADSHEKFRITHIRMSMDKVSRILLLSDWGSAVAIEFRNGEQDVVCQMTIDGNGWLSANCDGN